jgi:hypothetical protein
MTSGKIINTSNDPPLQASGQRTDQVPTVTIPTLPSTAISGISYG